MGRIYTVEFENVSVSSQVDFFEALPAAGKPIRLHALFLDQISDVGDAEEEILRFRVIRGHTTSGSGGGTATPRPVDPDDAAAAFTCETNNTTIASAGTGVNLHSGGFNIRSGIPLLFPPELQHKCKNAELLVVRLMAAPADALTMSGTLYVEEL